MSYDMGIGDWDTNYTVNGCMLWYDYLDEKDGIKSLYGKTGTEVMYQSIDHSKLVPLLVKTVQELEARIATLESK